MTNGIGHENWEDSIRCGGLREVKIAHWCTVAHIELLEISGSLAVSGRLPGFAALSSSSATQGSLQRTGVGPCLRIDIRAAVDEHLDDVCIS